MHIFPYFIYFNKFLRDVTQKFIMVPIIWVSLPNLTALLKSVLPGVKLKLLSPLFADVIDLYQDIF